MRQTANWRRPGTAVSVAEDTAPDPPFGALPSCQFPCLVRSPVNFRLIGSCRELWILKAVPDEEESERKEVTAAQRRKSEMAVWLPTKSEPGVPVPAGKC